MKKLVRKKCPVCQTTEYLIKLYEYPEGEVYICGQCHTGIFNGAKPKNDGADIDESGLFRFIKRFILNYEFGYLKKFKNKKIIEIGSGSGELAKMLSDYGLEITCNDVDKTSLKRIADHYRLKTVYGYLEKAGIKKHSFDGVVMRHVFEHIDDPEDFIKNVYDILAPKGKIFITQPNYDSLCRQIIGKNWTGFSIPSHRYYWSLSNLKLFLEKNGFKVTKSKTIFSHFGLPLNLYFSTPNKLMKMILAPFYLTFGSLLELIFVALGRGQNLFIEAQKV
jgi:SAM-dependent methyltransferase